MSFIFLCAISVCQDVVQQYIGKFYEAVLSALSGIVITRITMGLQLLVEASVTNSRLA
jgi:hypothetical protein